MSEKILKAYPAIVGFSDDFPEIFGWTGTAIELLDPGVYLFRPNGDSEWGYPLRWSEVYIPELDGEVFPIEKNYIKKKD